MDLNNMIYLTGAVMFASFIGTLIGYVRAEKRHYATEQELSRAKELIKAHRDNTAAQQVYINCLVSDLEKATVKESEVKRLIEDKRNLIDRTSSLERRMESKNAEIECLHAALYEDDSKHNKRMRARGARAHGIKLRKKHAKEVATCAAETKYAEEMAKRYARRIVCLQKSIRVALGDKVRLESVRKSLLAEIERVYDISRRNEVMGE